MKSPSVSKALESQGYSVVGSSPEMLLDTVKTEARALGEIIRARDIKLQ